MKMDVSIFRYLINYSGIWLLSFFIVNGFVPFDIVAQQTSNNSDSVRVDASKPTNLYTLINPNPEYIQRESGSTYGIRFIIQYALDSDNLFLAEVPFLAAPDQKSVGLGDLRLRYFSVVKRDLSSKVIALAPFADIRFPTGSFDKGLGTTSWSLAGGCIIGYTVSSKLSMFPGLSYIHVTKPSSDLILDSTKKTGNGVGMQLNASYSFSESHFVYINPTPSFMDYGAGWRMYWAGEVDLFWMVRPNKLLLDAYMGLDLTNNVRTYRLGASFFFGR